MKALLLWLCTGCAGATDHPAAAPLGDPPSPAAPSLPLLERSCAAGGAHECSLAGDVLADHLVHGVPRDDARMAVLYRRGCDLGDAEACSMLGFLYWEGLTTFVADPESGVRRYHWPDDRVLGLPYLRIACEELGRARSCELLRSVRPRP